MFSLSIACFQMAFKQAKHTFGMHSIIAYGHTVKGKHLLKFPHMRAISLERQIPRACRGCLTPSPRVTDVLTLSLARNDHYAHILGTSHFTLDSIASTCMFSMLSLVFLVCPIIDKVATPFCFISLFSSFAIICDTLPLFARCQSFWRRGTRIDYKKWQLRWGL